MQDPGNALTEDDGTATFLERRLGRLHARQRLGIEADHEAQAFGQGLNFFHVENWYSIHSVIRSVLTLAGLYGRGGRNAQNVQVRHNHVSCGRLPSAFEGFKILQISDMHADISEGAMRRVIDLLAGMEYDICVLTGDFRGKTFGPFSQAMEGVERVRLHLRRSVYGVLGNHDTIRMLPGLEAIGIRMLLNECVEIERGGARIHLAGIDDAHFFRMDNIEKAGDPIPQGGRRAAVAHPGDLPAGRPRGF